MQKFFCAIGFLTIVLILQDCLVPVEGVRVRVVKVKKPHDSHYTKRQATRTSYTDVPLSGDPDVDVEAFKVNTNSLRPEDNPYNAGNRQVDYPLNTNVGGNNNNNNNNYNRNDNPTRYNNNNNNNNRYNEDLNLDDNQHYDDQTYNNQGNVNSRPIVSTQFGAKMDRRYQQQQQQQSNGDEGYIGGGNQVVRQSNNNNNNSKRQSQSPQVSDTESVSTTTSAGEGTRRPVRKDGGDKEDCPGCGNSIPGDAGVDYPNFNRPPKTAFSCSKQSWSGYYADVEARCQVFWICQKNRADAFLCPNGTIFNQQVFVCDWWFNSDCNTAPDYYSRNQYLYAGPTVDLFGNAITPTTSTNKNSPFTAASRPARTTPATALSSSRPQLQSGSQPERLSTPPQQSLLQSQPKQQRSPPPPPPPQPQRLSSQNNALLTNTNTNKNNNNNQYINNNNNNNNLNRRNDNYIAPQVAATTFPPAQLQQQQQQPAVYNKRSHQSSLTYQSNNNNIDYSDRLKQPFNYPVPDNSLAAVEGEYGLRMNNYKTSVDYVDVPLNSNNNNQRQQSYHQQSQRQSSYSGSNNFNNNNNNNNNNGYSNNRNQDGYDVIADSQGGYASKSVQVKRQPLFSSASLTAHLATNTGFGQKQSSTVKRNPFISSSSIAATTISPRYSTQIQPASAVIPQQQQQQQPAYSSTTKRNAIDYDTENTTPYATSYDEDLLATVTTPRYGEVISKPNSIVYSSEYDGQSQETTTSAPLTFGQKLSRAAKKRNTSSWGNWLTLMS